MVVRFYHHDSIRLQPPLVSFIALMLIQAPSGAAGLPAATGLGSKGKPAWSSAIGDAPVFCSSWGARSSLSLGQLVASPWRGDSSDQYAQHWKEDNQEWEESNEPGGRPKEDPLA